MKLLVIFALGVAELWAAAPAGLAMGFHPFAVFLVAAAGSICGCVFIVLFGERVRNWIMKKRKPRPEGAGPGLFFRIWQRYGVIGWGLLAPLLTGTPLGAAIGLSLGAPSKKLLFWLCIGGVAWAAIFTLAARLGAHVLKH